MKRLATAWIVALVTLAAVGAWRGGIESGAQQTTTPEAGDATEMTESEELLTRVIDLQRNQDVLLAALADAQATERADLEATVTALEDQVAAAEATSVAQASEVAALQTQVADLEASLAGDPAPGPGVEVGLNEVATAGAWDITAIGFERADVIETERAPDPVEAQGVFVLVELEIVNTGTDAQKYDPTWFRITDDRGRSWPFDFTLTDTLSLAGAGARQYQALQPGIPATAVVVFDIAPDATGLSLRTLEDLAATSEPQPDPFTIHLEE